MKDLEENKSLDEIRSNIKKSLEDLFEKIEIENYRQPSGLEKRYKSLLHSIHCSSEKSKKKGLIALKKEIEKDPENIRLLSFTAQRYDEINDYDNAIKLFQRCKKLEPDNPNWTNNIGVIYSRIGEYDKALENYLETVEKEPKEPMFLLNAGLGYLHLDEIKKAEEFLNKADEINPYHCFGHYCKGLFALQKNLLPEALIEGLKAFSHGPEKRYFSLLSLIFEKFQNIDSLVSTLEDYFEETKDFTNGGPILANLLDAQGDIVKHEKIMKIIIRVLTNELNQKDELLNDISFQSSNPVKINLENPISENLYIIKTNNPKKKFSHEKERLTKEYATSLFLDNTLRLYGTDVLNGIIDEKFIIVPEPLLLFEKDKRIYFFQKRKKALNLQDICNNIYGEEKEEIIIQNIKSALESIAKIHYFATIELKKKFKKKIFTVADENKTYNITIPKLEINKEFLKRSFLKKKNDACPRLIFNSEIKEFFMEYSYFMEMTRELNFFIHGDFYATNVLEGGLIIDFEKVCIGDPTHDISQLLENPLFDKLNKEELLNHYTNELVDFEKNPKIPNIIQENYQKYRVHICLCETGAHLARGEFETAQRYAEKALSYMDGSLKDLFAQYLKTANYDFLRDIV
ncbi:MAG: tetratricopeptide repeat protein [Nanoarchaeota archaeon]|nr:tetratricopeptide repeat protein [Nanoarchaeota archaeon]